MAWFTRNKKKETLRNKTLKKRKFQNLRNWITNTKSSIKNYFAKKEANKEGRKFHPTMKAKEARERMERYGLGKRRSQGVFKNEQHPELTNSNVERLEELNLNAIKPVIGNEPNYNTNLPVKNSLKSAKDHLQKAKEDLVEIRAFESRLKEKKFWFEKTELIRQNEKMLEKHITGGQEQLEKARTAASVVENGANIPNFKREEARELMEEIDNLGSVFENTYLMFDNLYEYTENMAKTNIKRATFLAKRGTYSEISKALQKLKGIGDQESGEVLADYATALEELKQKLARERGARVQSMKRGSRGGSTRKQKH